MIACESKLYPHRALARRPSLYPKMSASTIIPKFVFILPVILFLAVAARAVDLTGTISDQNGDAIAGARVEARRLSSGTNLTAQTDISGKYRFTGLEPGEYRISAERAGFSVSAGNIRLDNSRAAGELNLTLFPGVIEDIVTITAAKGGVRAAGDTPNSITVVSGREIENRRPASVSQALANVPNLTTIGTNPFAARLRLRGLTANRLLVVVDGERLNNVRTDPASGISPATVDVTQLESAEVLSGSGSSLYGSDAIAGTINLVSRKPVFAGGGRYLGLRFDGDLTSNGSFRRAVPTLNLSTSRLSLRVSGSFFAGGSYRTGGEAITRAEVAQVADLAAQMSNLVETGVARSFAVWELPASAKVPNGQAEGSYGQLDLWLMPLAGHSVRYRQTNNRHRNVGFAFLSPPFDSRLQYNAFRRFDKYSVRYEGHDIAGPLPRIAGGIYVQEYTFPDNTFSYSINEGSSWVTEPVQGLPVITGGLSAFTPSNFTDGRSSITSYGADFQATFDLLRRGTFTTAISYLRDRSADSFSRQEYSAAVPPAQRNITGRASTPDSTYEDLGWSNLAEFEPVKILRLTASLRIDRWRTRASVTPGFPIATEGLILNRSFGQLESNPGAIDLAGVSGIRDLIGGTSGLRTGKTSVTSSLGALFKLRHGINPYFRWETSYREPGITERYILRNFGSRSFSLLLAPNTELKPERGTIYEAGLKIVRPQWRASINYFRNELKDFIGNEFSPALFIAPDPQNGLDPISPFFPMHGVLYVQRANTARARIQGVEAGYEASLPLGRLGSITPFGTLAWLKGSNLTPDDQTIALIGQFYNRTGTLIPLRGTVDDAPMAGIVPFTMQFGVRYSDRRGRWVGEYNMRYRARVKRADPTDLTASIGTQYGTFASLKASTADSLRFGYSFARERYRVLVSGGVDNIGNRLYFDPFQTAPAAGRTFLAGITIEGFDLWK